MANLWMKLLKLSELSISPYKILSVLGKVLIVFEVVLPCPHNSLILHMTTVH